MANDKTTITISRIDLQFRSYTLEQITTFEANRRDLKPTKAPTIFRRDRTEFRGCSEQTPFQITAEDFRGSREGNYNLVVPDNAVAYVIGEDSGAVNAHVGIYDNRGSNDVYIPVQFYKEQEK